MISYTNASPPAPRRGRRSVPTSADERLVRRALGDRHDVPFGGPGIELARAEETRLRVRDHLVPLCGPADRAGHGEDRREHRRRQPQGAEDEAGVEVDIGVELALDEII